jgi:fructose-bisphosphate aldolase class 1
MAMVADDKGLLAMDESTPTRDERFEKLGIPGTVEARRAYREMIPTTSGLGESINGVIAMNVRFRSLLPFPLTFSFARAIQQEAWEIWSGRDASVKPAQRALRHRAQRGSAARRGEYNAAGDVPAERNPHL